MTQTASPLLFNGSRLVRYLSELLSLDVDPASKEFAQRLGQFVGFGDSVKLSSLSGELNKLSFEPMSVSEQGLLDEFLRVRGTLLDSIAKSFAGSEELGFVKTRFPHSRDGKMPAFDAYQGFYTTYQREIEAKVQHLLSFARDVASGLSPELEKLVQLDIVVTDTLTVHTRKFFGVVPKLLKKRFEQLNDVKDEGSLQQFRRDTQGLLLAELEIRLYPVQGLIEAINQESDKQYD